MSDPTTCTNCSQLLESDAPGGVCPQCLMGLAMTGDAGGDQLDSRASQMLRADQLIGQFPDLEIVNLIGRGGMASVYHAKQTKLGRDVALKILSPHLSNDPAFTERFEREARTLARLNHPNIVSPFNFGQSGEFLYLVMELVEGVNLRDAMLAGQISPSMILEIIPCICSALQYAHDQGVIHRDIKPENILIDKQGVVKIVDFGLAKLTQPGEDEFTLTSTRQILGTLKYMAPEQIERPETVDHRADLYSLGVVFYELLTGELPIGRFSLPSEKAGVTTNLDQVVLKTLEKEPERRYQQASHFRTAVESLDHKEFQATEANEARNSNDRQSENGVLAYLPYQAYGPSPQHIAVRGIAKLYHDVIEFQFESSIWYMRDSKPETMEFDRANLVDVSLSTGIYWNKILVDTNSFESVAHLPGRDAGSFAIYFQKKDLDRATEFVKQLRSQLPDPQIPVNRPSPPLKQEPREIADELILTKERLKVPRMGLAIASILYLFATVVMIFGLGPRFLDVFSRYGFEFFMLLPGQEAVFWEMALLYLVGVAALSFFCGIAALLLTTLTNYHFLIASLVLVTIAVPLNILAAPFTIWALIVLFQSTAKRVFRELTLARGRELNATDQNDKSVSKRWMIFAAGAIVLTFFVLASLFVINQSRQYMKRLDIPVRQSELLDGEEDVEQESRQQLQTSR